MNLDKVTSLVSAINNYYPGGYKAMSLYVIKNVMRDENSSKRELLEEIVLELGEVKSE